MKKLFKAMITLVLSVACIVSVCMISVSASSSTVKLDTTSYTFTAIGKSYVMLATISPTPSNVNYSSNNSSIAIVQPTYHNGNKYYFKITSKGVGTTKINITANGVTSSMLITVSNGSGVTNYVNNTSSSNLDMRTRIGTPTTFTMTHDTDDNITVNLVAPNLMKKAVKEYVVILSMYNSGDQPALDSLTYKNTTSLDNTKGLVVGQNFTLNSWIAINSSCTKVAIDKITVTYQDGTIETGTYPYSCSLY